MFCFLHGFLKIRDRCRKACELHAGCGTCTGPPLQVAEDRFAQFRYAPDYLPGKHRPLRADGEIGPTLPFIKNCVRSEIVLNGGNVVRWRDAVILTDKIYRENPGMRRRELEKEFRGVLEVERMIVIPTEPGDVVGHADGVVRFVDGDTVSTNDYKLVNSRSRAALKRPLRCAGLEVVELPYPSWTKSRV